MHFSRVYVWVGVFVDIFMNRFRKYFNKIRHQFENTGQERVEELDKARTTHDGCNPYPKVKLLLGQSQDTNRWVGYTG